MTQNPSDFTVRKAQDTDITHVVRLLADDFLGRQRESYNLPLPASYWRSFELIRSDPNNHIIVLEHDGEIIGAMQITFIPCLTYRGGKRCQIEGVRVDRRMRGQGLGRLLIEWAIDEAREQGCHLVQLTMNKERLDVNDFYGALGFVGSHVGLKLHLDPHSN
jgi:GNAT superfamily N-acetyltransferase